MGNLTDHARTELKAAGLFDKDSDYNGMIGNAVMELMEVFSKQGHSGMSANLVRSIFNTVADFKPLCPLTGKDEEWQNDTDSELYQNKRCSAVFKDGKDGIPYYLDAIVWQGEESWDTFTGQVDGEKSRQYLKFPFTPKTFYVNVYRVDYDKEKHKDMDYIEGNDEKYVQYIKDREQLKEVWEYYIKPTD